MQAKEIYDLACRCYNGDETARAEWLALLAPIAQKVAVFYGVLPGVVLARAACESGWGSDLYELTMEKEFNVSFARKAQRHNNMVGMVAYGGNDTYMPGLPPTEWTKYRSTFDDYGPHGDMNGSYGVTMETWKEYRSIDECFEDFCSVIRSQAWKRGEDWPSDLVGQLLSMGRGYTPEGGASRRGMAYAWQDNTLDMYEKYKLWKYDMEVIVMKQKPVTVKSLLEAIKEAFRYAHAHCQYGRTDTHYPPGENGKIDCVGLIFRALYLLGWYGYIMNIDQLHDLCLSVGMKKTTDINDAWKRPCVVCMQDRCNKGTQHINHVFYSLGGSSLKDISKYDLGSDERIRSQQPFKHVPVNEWGNRIFLCAYYPAPDAVPEWDNGTFFTGTVTKDVGLYTGPGTEYKKIRVLKKGEALIYSLRITNPAGKDWRYVTVGDQHGYIYYAPVTRCGYFKPYKAKIRGDLKDGYAAVRVGAGTDCPEAFRIPAGGSVTVDGCATDTGGDEWLHVYIVDGKGKKQRGYIYAGLTE